MSAPCYPTAAPAPPLPHLTELTHCRAAIEAAPCGHRLDLCLLGVHVRLLTDDAGLAEVIGSTYLAPAFAPRRDSLPAVVFRALREAPGGWPLVMSWEGRASFVRWNPADVRFDQWGVYWESGVQRPEGYFATRDLTPDSATPEAVTDLFAVVVERRLLSEALARRRGYYLVHAGVVAGKGKAALLVGGSMLGKTTLTLTLATRGLDFLSDDFAPVDGASGLVHPFPTALRVREQTLGLLPGLRLPEARWQVDANGHRRAYLDPYALLQVAAAPVPLGAVFLLDGFGDHALARAVDPTHALFQALRCANLPVDQPGVALLSLSPHFTQAHCFQLRQGPPEESARLVERLMDGSDG